MKHALALSPASRGGGAGFEPGADVALDFAGGRYRVGAGAHSLPDFASLAGASVTRSSTGYALTEAGTLVQFGTNVARITDKGLLVEEARTNLLLRSQEFDNASWGKARSSVTANAAGAPDSTTTADKLVEDTTASATHLTTQTVTVSAATSYSFSVYLKAAERSKIRLQENSGSIWQVDVDLAAGSVSVTTGSATIQSLANGWYRVNITATTGGAQTSIIAAAYLRDGSGSTSYNGDGASGLYVWGAQLEAGSFPTSYIPTTSSTATRAADSISLSGLSGLSSTPLTVVYSFTAVALTSSPTLFLLDDGTANNRVLSYYNTGALGFNVDSGGASQVSVTAAVPVAGATTNRAVRVATNDFRVYSDGVAGSSDTTVTLPTALSALRIGRSLAGAVAGSTYHRNFHIYPRAFSDAELQQVTQ